ncbi:MAG: glycerophosphodiester phosphodiesterase family protein, partial [Gammaproteobacteria bacterium]|nr:glycerophosphodiester phosphodiesterase family protein [Gammaproteobacteria bacterium]
MFRLLLICSALLTSACNLLPTNGDSENSQSLIIAHRASSGLWHQNSRNAVEQTIKAFSQGSLKKRIHGIELDIVLTQDHVPVLSHDPWVHKTLCTKKDGSPVGHQLIRDIPFHKLSEDYLCGGIIDPEFPNASTKAESILGFDELLALLETAPTLAVYLDIKVEAATTQSAEAYAKAIFQRWQQAQLPNAHYMA